MVSPAPPRHPSNKPGKIRRVLNDAAKFQGSSMKNALLMGPDLLQSLYHILIRFRQYPYAVSADIEGMFLQVGVIPDDRPSLRFLLREPSCRSCCVLVRSPYLWIQRLSPMCELCTETNSNGQCITVFRSRPKRHQHLRHG